MTRICFISLSAYGYFNETAPAGGGAQRQFHLLSSGLTDTFDVNFIVGDYGQPKTEHRMGVTLHRAFTPAQNASLSQRGKQIAKLYFTLKKANSDIYIIRCSPKKFAIIYLLVSALRRPLLYHIATDAFVEKQPLDVDGGFKTLYAKALQDCPVVAQTQRQADQLKKHWGVDATVIPNGYPPSSVIDLHSSREYFLWVGRLSELEKKPHLFLDLADKIPSEQFVLIGSPERDDEYTRQVIDRARTTPNVSYLSEVPPSEIHDYYRRATALINTSEEQHEGFPNTFLEAWRYATPVLSLNLNPGRFLNPDQGMFGYANHKFTTLVSLTQQLANSLKQRKKLGILGMGAFEANYQLSATVEDYEQLLREIIE